MAAHTQRVSVRRMEVSATLAMTACKCCCDTVTVSAGTERGRPATPPAGVASLRLLAALVLLFAAVPAALGVAAAAAGAAGAAAIDEGL